MKEASAEQRKPIAAAISAGRPERRSGVPPTKASTNHGLVASRYAVSGVSITPGAIAFTRMPSMP